MNAQKRIRDALLASHSASTRAKGERRMMIFRKLGGEAPIYPPRRGWWSVDSEDLRSQHFLGWDVFHVLDRIEREPDAEGGAP